MSQPPGKDPGKGPGKGPGKIKRFGQKLKGVRDRMFDSRGASNSGEQGQQPPQQTQRPEISRPIVEPGNEPSRVTFGQLPQAQQPASQQPPPPLQQPRPNDPVASGSGLPFGGQRDSSSGDSLYAPGPGRPGQNQPQNQAGPAPQPPSGVLPPQPGQAPGNNDPTRLSAGTAGGAGDTRWYSSSSDPSSGNPSSVAGPSAAEKGKMPMTEAQMTQDPRQSGASAGAASNSSGSDPASVQEISQQNDKGKNSVAPDPRQSAWSATTATTQATTSSSGSGSNGIAEIGQAGPAAPPPATAANLQFTAANPTGLAGMQVLQNPPAPHPAPPHASYSSTLAAGSATPSGSIRDSMATNATSTSVASDSTVAGPSGTGGQPQ
jgi:hypothetical protein